MNGSAFIARRLFFHFQKGPQGHPLVGAAIGIALSLIPLIVVDHFAAGMIEGIIARYRETSTYHFQVHARDADVSREDWENLASDIRQRPDIKTSWIERTGYALAGNKNRRDGLTIRSLPPDALQRDQSLARYIEFDQGEWNLDGKSILLGREAARHLNVEVGQSLFLITAGRLNQNAIARPVKLKLQGIFSTGYQELDRTWAFISSDLGWEILPDSSSTTFVGGKFDNIAQNNSLWSYLTLQIGPEWSVYDWKQINSYLLDSLGNTRLILLVIMALIIVIAVLNVMTSLGMLIIERRREIGILKCTGSSASDITKIFVMSGLLAAFVGTLIGIGCGLLISYFVNEIIHLIESTIAFVYGLFGNEHSPVLLDEQYYLQKIPINIRWRSTYYIGLITLILSFFASWIPSKRASKFKPLEVLRKH